MNNQHSVIKNWNSIKNDFCDSKLIAGNGLSIYFNQSCKYGSLINLIREFIQKVKDPNKEIPNLDNSQPRDIKHEDLKRFEKILGINSTDVNIEIIMFRLHQAKETAKLLGDTIDESTMDKILDFYDVQDNLAKRVFIKIINEIHPLFDEKIKNRIQNCSNFISCFRYVFSLSYDLYLYWGILCQNDAPERNDLWQDGFRKIRDTVFPQTSYIEYPLIFSEESIESNEKKTLFYIHGNLCLYKGIYSNITKCARENNGTILLDIIRKQISMGYVPFIVTERDSKQKEKMILQEKSYSRIVYNRFLPEKFTEVSNSDFSLQGNNSLVIYGCSLENDEHVIRKALENSECKRIAISLHKQNDGSFNQKPKENLERILKDFGDRNIEIICFDSQSIFPT